MPRSKLRSKLNGKFVSFYRQNPKVLCTLNHNTDSPQLKVLFQLRNFHCVEIRFHFFKWDCFKIVVANIKLQVHSKLFCHDIVYPA